MTCLSRTAFCPFCSTACKYGGLVRRFPSTLRITYVSTDVALVQTPRFPVLPSSRPAADANCASSAKYGLAFILPGQQSDSQMGKLPVPSLCKQCATSTADEGDART